VLVEKQRLFVVYWHGRTFDREKELGNQESTTGRAPRHRGRVHGSQGSMSSKTVYPAGCIPSARYVC
jgi:hypothetical protein